MDSFGKGFFGCLGVLAAIVAVGGAIFIWAALRSSAASDDLIEGRAEARDYRLHCVGAVVAAGQLARQAAGAELAREDPAVTFRGKNPLVSCPARGRDGSEIRVTIRIVCSDPVGEGCSRITWVSRNGEPLWTGGS